MSWLVRIVLVVLGILAVVVGVIYVIEPLHSLPSFFPGHALHGQGHHHTRGYIAIAVGVVLLILAGIVRRSRRASW
jgi:NADH:ubiquinone oxidoreductase subunit 5 (subunit L)/multisubunit Na+/H+ antiporter MnhA subunit